MKDVTEIWKKYESGKAQHNVAGMYTKTERCHRFYEGEQWHGLQSGGEELPVLNFIKPVCTFKVAVVAANNTSVIYSGEDAPAAQLLTKLAAAQWESSKMDLKKWEIVKNACITGDHYAYCHDIRQFGGSVARSKTPKIGVRLINKTDVYFANEQCTDISAQEWIIIAERKSVATLRREAKQNGMSAADIESIVPDTCTEADIGVSDAMEVKQTSGKCTSLLFMRKTADGLEFCRSTQGLIYQKTQLIKGLDTYPLCAMRWSARLGSARGVGVVEGMIANQIEVNRTIARRAVMVKKHGFASLVYDQDKIANPEALGKVGASIAVRNLEANPINSIVQYLTPSPMSADAAALQKELITLTRELEGASEAATGQVNPEKASGEAIKAARDQNALSLTEQTAAYTQFCEDLALIWYKLWVAYSPMGLEAFGELLSPERLQGFLDNIRIDISPADPYSRLARELALENALEKGHITFEEYVGALDQGTALPKDKLESILKKREIYG